MLHRNMFPNIGYHAAAIINLARNIVGYRKKDLHPEPSSSSYSFNRTIDFCLICLATLYEVNQTIQETKPDK